MQRLSSLARAIATTDGNRNMTDDPVTHEQYIERWEQALRVLESMTEHERRLHFDMTSWGKQTHCGTVACLAGHCSLDLWFRERGFSGQVDETGLYFTGADP